MSSAKCRPFCLGLIMLTSLMPGHLLEYGITSNISRTHKNPQIPVTINIEMQRQTGRHTNVLDPDEHRPRCHFSLFNAPFPGQMRQLIDNTKLLIKYSKVHKQNDPSTATMIYNRGPTVINVSGLMLG